MTPEQPIIKCKPENLPAELHDYPHWVVWRLVANAGGKSRKIPYNPTSGIEAKSNDPSTWTTFEGACAAFHAGDYDGVGFMFHTADPFVAIDIDSCFDPTTGQIGQAVLVYIARLDSYTETSQSGTGLHIIVRGTKPGAACRRGHYEMYSEGRFIALTGAMDQTMPPGIEDRQHQLDAIYQEWFSESNQKTARSRGVEPVPLTPDDHEILRIAFANKKNGDVIHDLFDGGSGKYPTPSEADSALAFYLAYYCKTFGGVEQLERLMHSSARVRDKWNERRGNGTWLLLECQSAIDKVSSQYNPTVQATGINETTAQRMMPADIGATTDKFVDQVAGQVSRYAQIECWGLVMRNDLTPHEFETLGKLLIAAKRRTDDIYQWLLGDWYRQYKPAWGKREEQITQWIGKGYYESVRKWARVVIMWPRERRRPDKPFWLHDILKNLNHDEQDQWFARYEKGGCTRQMIRAYFDKVAGDKSAFRPSSVHGNVLPDCLVPITSTHANKLQIERLCQVRHMTRGKPSVPVSGNHLQRYVSDQRALLAKIEAGEMNVSEFDLWLHAHSIPDV